MVYFGDLEKVAQGRTRTRSRGSRSLTELNVLSAVSCVPARRKHCNADSAPRGGLPCAPSAGPTRLHTGPLGAPAPMLHRTGRAEATNVASSCHLRLVDFDRNACRPSQTKTIQVTQRRFKQWILSNGILQLFFKKKKKKKAVQALNIMQAHHHNFRLSSCRSRNNCCLGLT